MRGRLGAGLFLGMIIAGVFLERAPASPRGKSAARIYDEYFFSGVEDEISDTEKYETRNKNASKKADPLDVYQVQEAKKRKVKALPTAVRPKSHRSPASIKDEVKKSSPPPKAKKRKKRKVKHSP